MEKVQETEFVPFDVWEEFNKSAFSYFHKGVVICSGDRTESNAMTIAGELLAATWGTGTRRWRSMSHRPATPMN